MYRLLLFLKAIHVVLLFIVLEAAASYLFFTRNPYQRAVAINASNKVLGSLHERTTKIADYFALAGENDKLLEENAKLRQKLSQYTQQDTIPMPQTIADTYIGARVINNSISGLNNYITIDKGSVDGIVKDMALMTNEGIVGYVMATSPRFSVAISILNGRDFMTSGRLKGSDNTGNISWNGRNHRMVQFTGVPKYAPIALGDTITTTLYSDIFPDNYPIGVVRRFRLDNGTTFNAEVELFADLSRLRFVYAVMNPQHTERSELEQKNIRNDHQ